MTLVIGKSYVILAKFPGMQNFRKVAKHTRSEDGIALCTRNALAEVYRISNVSAVNRFYHDFELLKRAYPQATWSYRQMKEAA